MKSRESHERPSRVLSSQRIRVKKKKNRYGWLITLAGAVGVSVLLVRVVFGLGLVQGDSMRPHYGGSEVVVFLRLGKEYETGDILVIKTEDKKNAIKRVIGAPGDEVDIDEETGEVLINGRVMEEPYIHESTPPKDSMEYPVSLGEGEYFLMGDHRENSKDSRNYGAVNYKKIQGKVLLSIRKE